jgi:hypothetical protein
MKTSNKEDKVQSQQLLGHQKVEGAPEECL